MRVTVPDYFENFQCLAGECPHTCCEKWEVVIDADSAERYMSVPGALGDKLRSALKRDEDGDLCFPLEGGRCPFLDGDNLCEIHKKLGEAATSVTCREHPRFTEDYGPFREITLSASCPAANSLLLGSESPLTFRTFETEEVGEEGDEWLEYLLPLRERLLDILRDRSRPLKARLASFLALALSAQACLDEDCPESLPQAEEAVLTPAAEGLFPGALELLASLEVLDADWPALLERAEAAAPGAAREWWRGWRRSAAWLKGSGGSAARSSTMMAIWTPCWRPSAGRRPFPRGRFWWSCVGDGLCALCHL